MLVYRPYLGNVPSKMTDNLTNVGTIGGEIRWRQRDGPIEDVKDMAKKKDTLIHLRHDQREANARLFPGKQMCPI